MRIIAGTARSILLVKLSGKDIRPTPERVRESIFNILIPQLDETTVFLDLFTGTGVNALEALSRGAKQAILVDSASESLNIARKNAQKTKLENQCRFVRGAIPNKLDYIAKNFLPATIVFADPPYAYPDYPGLLEALSIPNLLAPDALVLIEHDNRHTLTEQVLNLQQYRVQTYGSTNISFYKNVPDS